MKNYPAAYRGPHSLAAAAGRIPPHDLKKLNQDPQDDTGGVTQEKNIGDNWQHPSQAIAHISTKTNSAHRHNRCEP